MKQEKERIDFSYQVATNVVGLGTSSVGADEFAGH